MLKQCMHTEKMQVCICKNKQSMISKFQIQRVHKSKIQIHQKFLPEVKCNPATLANSALIVPCFSIILLYFSLRGAITL